MDEEIIRYCRQKYNLLIGERMAERTKVASAPHTLPEEQTITVRGRNLITGLPDAVEVSSVEVREALSGPISIMEAVKTTLDETPRTGGRPRSWASPWPEAARSCNSARPPVEETRMRVPGGGLGHLRGARGRRGRRTCYRRCWPPPKTGATSSELCHP